MKKIFYLFSFILLSASVSLNAQTAAKCSNAAKACCKSSKTCVKGNKACCASASTATVACKKGKICAKSAALINRKASELASTDASIVGKVCETSGQMCYYKTAVDSKGNQVKNKVAYNVESNSFVAVNTDNSLKSPQAKALFKDISTTKPSTMTSETRVVAKKAVVNQ